MAQRKEPNVTEQKDVMSTEVTVKAIPVADPAALGLIGLAVAALVPRGC